jgi:hypothetical protein
MKNWLRVLLPAAVLVLVLPFLWSVRESSSAQQRAPEAAVRWEYRVLAPVDNPRQMEADLNALGQDGWELGWTIGKISGKQGYASGSGSGALDTKVYFVLKRPKR